MKVVESGTTRIGIEEGGTFTRFRWLESLPDSMSNDINKAGKMILYDW